MMHLRRCLIALLLVALTAGADAAPGAEADAGKASTHWAFVPPTRPIPSAVRNSRWVRTPIDAFILGRLEREGLAPAPAADRLTLLRRLTLDLTGLPPSSGEVEAFLKDGRADALERRVDALLASPRYGERWAQHWLDVVRYADTHGFEVNTERPNAWPYRDYVIRAFNQDTPYDRFIREQLVGEQLGEDAATGFLLTASVLLPGQIGADDVSKRLARQDAIDEIVVNIGQTFLGLSVGCARCHDHKFDPIPARDYYAMQAFVAGVEYEDRELRTPEAEARRREERALKERVAGIDRQLTRFVPLARPRPGKSAGTSAPGAAPAGAAPLRPAVNARVNADRFEPVPTRRVRFTIKDTNNLEPCLDELEVYDLDGANVALAAAGATVTTSGDTVVADRHERRFVHDGAYGNSRSWMSNERGKGWVIVEFPQRVTVDRVVWGRDREGRFADRLATNYVIEVDDGEGRWRVVADASDRAGKPAEDAGAGGILAGLSPSEAAAAKQWMDERKTIEDRLRILGQGRVAFAGKFRTPDRIHVLHRGDPEQPKDEVAPATLSALGARRFPRELPEPERRRALAEWIASPENPLTARVIVNRIWQGHFGTGLVGTPSDLGRNGAPPSHPELLDWLATEFVAGGWSIKRLHRLIVLSAVYGQDASGAAPAQALQRDADDRLLWRYPSRRLEAEAIRDAMLAVSGRLDLKMYGRGFDLFNQRGGLSGFQPVESPRGDALRRMIYAHKVRREREAVFGAFDCPDAGQSTARRRESTTPIQALNLFNSRFTIEQADAFAARVKAEVGDDVAAQVRRAYQLALARAPAGPELAEAVPVVRRHGLAVLGRALFNSSEFLFLP